MVPNVMYCVSVLMFWRDYSRYTRTRELPWLSRHLPDWLPAFPLDITSRMQVACHWSAAGHVTLVLGCDWCRSRPSPRPTSLTTTWRC